MNDSIKPEFCYCQASRRGARLMSRIYDRHLAPAGISISQFGILSRIARQPGVLIADLADGMVMERTTLVRALKLLRDAGLVQDRAEGTGRSLALVLSESGMKKLEEAKPYWIDAQLEFEERFGRARARQLREELLAVSAAY
jgi:DNA-binding MarR family transcriptional regulator